MSQRPTSSGGPAAHTPPALLWLEATCSKVLDGLRIVSGAVTDEVGRGLGTAHLRRTELFCSRRIVVAVQQCARSIRIARKPKEA